MDIEENNKTIADFLDNWLIEKLINGDEIDNRTVALKIKALRNEQEPYCQSIIGY